MRNPAKAFVGKADHRLAVELRGKRLGQRRAKHGSADRTARDTVQKVVVVRLRLEFPLVDRAAAPLCFDAVFSGQMLCEELMSSGDPSVERERPLVADGNREPGVNKTLPVVRRIARFPATFGIIQLNPSRSPCCLRYSVMGFEDAPTYLPCDGRITPAREL